jgi:hypothetical protein
MAIVARDMTVGHAGFRELVEKRIKGQEMFGVADVAAVFDVGTTKVREWIEEGRLPCANLNTGIVRGGDELRPLWRITRSAVLEMAERMEKGF